MLGLGNSIINGDVSGGFSTPADLPGIIHWWKHNTDLYNISDEFPGDDEGVYKWLDQIGGEHGVAQTESSRPKYVLSETSLNFNGAAKVLTVQSRVEDAGGNIDLGASTFPVSVINANTFE